MTWREFTLLKDGRERVTKRNDLDNWQRTRLLAYITGKPYFEKRYQSLTVYEFMPLPGDPTKEEIEAIKTEKQKQEEKEALQMIAHYEKLGLIGKNAVKN